MRDKGKPLKSLSASLLRKIEIPALSVYTSNNPFDFFNSNKFKEDPEERPKETVKPAYGSKRKGANSASTSTHSHNVISPLASTANGNAKGATSETSESSKDQMSIDQINHMESSGGTPSLVLPTSPSTPELAVSPTSPSPGIPSSPTSLLNTLDSEKESVLTEVQLYLVKALKSFGGAAPLNSIQDYVSKGWSKLRKRDGTRYTYDYRRVISASLANTSSISPLFEKHPTKPNWWILGPKAKTITIDLDQYFKDEEPSANSSPDAAMEEAKGSDGEGDLDEDEEHEVVRRKRNMAQDDIPSKFHKRDEEDSSSSTPATPTANSTPSETYPQVLPTRLL
jgi:hypothetical protein